MQLQNVLHNEVKKAAQSLYGTAIEDSMIQLQPTRPEFEGDFTLVAFPLVKIARLKPDEVAEAIGNELQKSSAYVAYFNVIKGFCNITLKPSCWIDFMRNALSDGAFGTLAANGQTVVVEYSSPNTNKPLHLGHIRNNLLGYSVSQILKAAGYNVKMVQIINDRGIHICKSMLAWQLFGNGETPQESGLKGDHLVGKYYVEFENQFRKEYSVWQTTEQAKTAYDAWATDAKNIGRAEKELERSKQKAAEKAEEGAVEIAVSPEDVQAYFFKEIYKNTYFNEYSTLGKAAKQMLQDWENGNAEVVALWEKMNGWVYQGFEQTYHQLGVTFDKFYYESKTYLTGKDLVTNNLQSEKPIFYTKEDGSVWIDLSDVKLDQKAVLRNDGTSMYITQDLGTANLRFQDFDMDKMIYVVGNEQEYHFQVLFEILKRLGHKYAKNCYHLSYGMVHLTTGKMKSREGTVVDADDLMAQLEAEVQSESKERATLEGMTEAAQQHIWHTVALGALKFYILKVEPKKTMVFDPKQSIDLQGQTGAYVQNAHVRTQAVQRKWAEQKMTETDYTGYSLHPIEREMLVKMHAYPSIVASAAANYNPAEVANYLYEIAKLYHQFWNTVTILDKNDTAAASFRLDLSRAVAKVLQLGGALLGMGMPDKM